MISYSPMNVLSFKNLLDNKDNELIIRNINENIIIKYNKKKLNKSNIKSLGLFRSIITNEQGKILSFAPPKSLYVDEFINENKVEDCYFEEFIEGTMINAFWDNSIEDWNIATKSNIGARCKYGVNSNNKTFRYMFLDAMNHCGLEFNQLNKNYIYSFVVQHPENRIVIPIIQPQLYLIALYEVNNYNLVHKIENIILDNVKIPKRYKYIDIKDKFGESWQLIRNYFNNDDLDYKTHGIIVYNKIGNRLKIRSKNYEKVKMLKGNTPKLQFHYYYLRQNGLVKDFLTYYPEYKEEFRVLRNTLHNFTEQLYQYYISCYIKKQKKVKEFPYNYKIHMFNLHKIYIEKLMQEKKFVSKQVVIDYINGLHAAKLMYSINHIYNKFKLEEKTADVLQEI